LLNQWNTGCVLA